MTLPGCSQGRAQDPRLPVSGSWVLKLSVIAESFSTDTAQVKEGRQQLDVLLLSGPQFLHLPMGDGAVVTAMAQPALTCH